MREKLTMELSGKASHHSMIPMVAARPAAPTRVAVVSRARGGAGLKQLDRPQRSLWDDGASRFTTSATIFQRDVMFSFLSDERGKKRSRDVLGKCCGALLTANICGD